MMASEGVGETTLLNAAGGETTVLHNAEFAYLLRKDTGERILINTQPFLIGKEQRKVNYCIRDNTSVSRCHAKISKQGWQYYIEDQNSTNGTYVEGKALHPYQETALSDNVTIRLSDEVFEFHFCLRKRKESSAWDDSFGSPVDCRMVFDRTCWRFSCLWAYRRRAAADKRPDLCAERN